MSSIVRNMWISVARLAVLGAVFVLPAGAASAAERPSWLPSRERALIVAVAGDEATLTWTSKKGQFYTLLYTDTQTGQAVFQPLPGYERMPGTGKTETVKLKVDPARPRRFNLRVETK